MLAGFGGSNIGVAQAYIADITTKKERSKGMGLIGAAFGLGFVFGPIMGGLLSDYGYSIVGYSSASFSFCAFLFASFFLKESLLNKKRSKIKIRLFEKESLVLLFSQKKVSLLALIFFIIIFSVANIYGTFALLGYKVYGLHDRDIGYLFSINGIIGALMQGGLIRILSSKFMEKNLVIWGLGFMMIGLGLMPYGINFIGLAGIMGVLSIGTGLLQPTILSMISKYSPDEHQGSILGLNQSFAALARVLGPLWGGFAFEFLGYEFPFLTGGLFTLVTLFIAYFLLDSKNNANED
jgi:MFS family permease